MVQETNWNNEREKEKKRMIEFWHPYYQGGVFDECGSSDNDDGQPLLGGRAIAVVGYGTDEESGQDFWLLKNNFGERWGEQGFMRLRRGVNACNIGEYLVVIDCEERVEEKKKNGGGGCVFEKNNNSGRGGQTRCSGWWWWCLKKVMEK